MADGGDNIFVYMGGEQEVPDDVTHVIIDRSVKIILRAAFARRRRLVSVNMHDEVGKIEEDAFCGCISLRKIKLIGVREVEKAAFFSCRNLKDVEFGDKLERIRDYAFNCCISLQKIQMPSVRTIGDGTFANCAQLTDVEFGCNLESIQRYDLGSCPNLRRIVIPLKDGIFPLDPTQRRFAQFDYCNNLTTVDLVGGIHKTISSLHLDSWKSQMNQQINRVNLTLPTVPAGSKTTFIQDWIVSTHRRFNHCKKEHYKLLKEATTLLELALWKSIIEVNANSSIEVNPKKKAKIDDMASRTKQRIASGAAMSIVIKNVFPFLRLEE